MAAHHDAEDTGVLIRLADAASKLGIAAETLLAWGRRGRFPLRQPGGARSWYFIHRDDLARLIREQAGPADDREQH